MYANCHITEISVKTNTFAEECKQRTKHIEYYNTSEVGRMSKKLRIMAARAIMDS